MFCLTGRCRRRRRHHSSAPWVVSVPNAKHTHVHTHARTHTHTHTHTRTHTYTHTRTHAHARTHTHTHTKTQREIKRPVLGAEGTDLTSRFTKQYIPSTVCSRNIPLMSAPQRSTQNVWKQSVICCTCCCTCRRVFSIIYVSPTRPLPATYGIWCETTRRGFVSCGISATTGTAVGAGTGGGGGGGEGEG